MDRQSHAYKVDQTNKSLEPLNAASEWVLAKWGGFDTLRSYQSEIMQKKLDDTKDALNAATRYNRYNEVRRVARDLIDLLREADKRAVKKAAPVHEDWPYIRSVFNAFPGAWLRKER